MVGPFFYIKDKSLGYQGILFEAVPEASSEVYADHITSPFGHADLFDRKFGETSADYFEYPRGRVVYDCKRNLHLIYSDKCILDKVAEIVRLFNIDKYEIHYDEHYVCPQCRGEIEI